MHCGLERAGKECQQRREKEGCWHLSQSAEEQEQMCGGGGVKAETAFREHVSSPGQRQACLRVCWEGRCGHLLVECPLAKRDVCAVL